MKNKLFPMKITDKKKGTIMGRDYASLLKRFIGQEVHYWGGLLYGEDGFFLDHYTNTREKLEQMWPKIMANGWVVRTRTNSARYSLALGVEELIQAKKREYRNKYHDK